MNTNVPPNIIVLAGPNGAGKSTTGPALLRDTLGITEFVDADTIARGLSAFEPERVALAAGKVMIRRRYRAGLRNFFELYRPLATTWRMYDNSRAAGPRLIAWGTGRRTTRLADAKTWTRVLEGAGHEE